LVAVRLPWIDVDVDLSDAGDVVDDVVLDRLGDRVRVGQALAPVRGDRQGDVQRPPGPARLHPADAADARRVVGDVLDVADDRRVDGVEEAGEHRLRRV